MSRADRIALLFSLLAALASYLVSDLVFEQMAHIEDEMAYVWQAEAIVRGHLTIPSPPEEKSFLVPFVVDYNGLRFGKYPLGWPVFLALGLFLGIRSLVNPLLAGLGVWLIYRLGKLAFGEIVALLAAGLTLTSPFFLLNSGSLLSHPFGLVLSAAFALTWLDAFGNPAAPRRWLPVLVAAFSLGVLALTRPLSAVAVAAPFSLHGLYLLVRGDWLVRRRVLLLGGLVLALASIHFLWQYAVTGNPSLNPYILWWDYDRVGFGVGVGRGPQGHSLEQAYANARYSLRSGARDLFGWGAYSWIFLPFGLLALGRNWRGWLSGSVFLSLVIFYLAYWIGAALFGPRYYYEGLYSLTLLSASGIAFLAGWPVRPGAMREPATSWMRLRPYLVSAVLLSLIIYNLTVYLPPRLGEMVGLYGVERSRLQPFLAPQAQQYTPALVIVHPEEKWTEYGSLLELQDPFLTTPFIFVHTRGPEVDAEVASHYRDRKIYHYYPEEPYRFYTTPRP